MTQSETIHVYKDNEWLMVVRDSGHTFNLAEDEVEALRGYFLHEHYGQVFKEMEEN